MIVSQTKPQKSHGKIMTLGVFEIKAFKAKLKTSVFGVFIKVYLHQISTSQLLITEINSGQTDERTD